ncbi:MAG: hypothetical protein KC503_30805 [Myxococcales bacterium]|nr:hypothetical protein [Myxococcales bacterium]
MDAWQFLSEAFGELPWQQQPPTERVREDHRATLLVGGLVFQIRRTYQLVTSGTGRGSSYLRWRTEITYPYAPRPLLLILPRNHIAYARIPTGDAEFDKRFRLSGAPPEILRRAFDEPLRKRLLAGAGRWRLVPTAEGKAFSIDVESIIEQGATPAELREVLDLFALVCQRIVGEYDRAHAEAKAAGPQAEAAWVEAQKLAAANAKRGAMGLKLAILGAGALLIIGLVALMALMF